MSHCERIIDRVYINYPRKVSSLFGLIGSEEKTLGVRRVLMGTGECFTLETTSETSKVGSSLYDEPTSSLVKEEDPDFLDGSISPLLLVKPFTHGVP